MDDSLSPFLHFLAILLAICSVSCFPIALYLEHRRKRKVKQFYIDDGFIGRRFKGSAQSSPLHRYAQRGVSHETSSDSDEMLAAFVVANAVSSLSQAHADKTWDEVTPSDAHHRHHVTETWQNSGNGGDAAGSGASGSWSEPVSCSSNVNDSYGSSSSSSDSYSSSYDSSSSDSSSCSSSSD